MIETVENELAEYPGFSKIPRLNRDITISEKIDGTNSLIYINDNGEIRVGSKNRWLTFEEDNYGLFKWVAEREEEIKKLGPGHHYGEFYGGKIQRGYGIKEKRFALFNVKRWTDPTKGTVPSCLEVVPVLYQGKFSQPDINYIVHDLKVNGSKAVQDYAFPEGVIVHHSASNHLYKITIEDDEKPKGSTEA